MNFQFLKSQKQFLEEGSKIVLNDVTVALEERDQTRTYNLNTTFDQYIGFAIRPAEKIIKQSEEQYLTLNGFKLFLIHQNPDFNVPMAASYLTSGSSSKLNEIWSVFWRMLPDLSTHYKLPFILNDDFYESEDFFSDGLSKSIKERNVMSKALENLTDVKFTDFIVWKATKGAFIAEQKNDKGGAFIGLFGILIGVVILFMTPAYYNLIGTLPCILGLSYILFGFKKTTLGFHSSHLLQRRKMFFGMYNREIQIPYDDLQFIQLEKEAAHGSERLFFIGRNDNFHFTQDLNRKVLQTYRAMFVLAACDYSKFSEFLGNHGINRRRK